MANKILLNKIERDRDTYLKKNKRKNKIERDKVSNLDCFQGFCNTP